MNNITTGDRIKELRQKRRWSQAELASKINTDSTIISRWETNRVNVSQRYIVKLARALGTSANFLLGETDNPDLSDDVQSSANISTVNSVGEENGDRLIIKKGDLYINLPETSEGFRVLDKLLDSNVIGSLAVSR